MNNNYLYEEQPQVLKELNNMVKKGHVPHALIFYGEKSTSKVEVALEFSKMLYEKNLSKDINEYEFNHLIDIHEHPNIKHIKRDSKSSITIDAAREIMNDNNLYSEYPGPIIYIFEDADYFNSSSINSILKFVEEPKDDTYIIFIVENLNNLLPTIQSRSILINFKPLDKERVVEKLSHEGLDKDILNVIAEYRKKEDEIINIYNDSKYIDCYNAVIDLINEPFERNGSLVLINTESFKKIKDNELQEFYVSLLVFVFEDLLKIKRSDYNIIFNNYLNRLTQVQNQFTESKLIDAIKNLLELKSYISRKTQVNTTLFLNNLFLDLEMSSTGKR